MGSRTLAKSEAFIKEVEGAHDATPYGSYEEVLDDPQVIAVYIPLPTSMHVQWVEAAAAKGKHVLLEKPIAMVGPGAVSLALSMDRLFAWESNFDHYKVQSKHR